MSLGLAKTRILKLARDPAKKATTSGGGIPPKHAEPTQAVRPQKPPKNKPARTPEAVEPLRVQHKLVLNDRQKATVQRLLEAPQVLADLVRAHPVPIKEAKDASLFLLTHRRELDPYIQEEARNRSVDFLTDLLIQWSDAPPTSVGIDFEDVSLTQDDRVYLPLDGLRVIPVSDPALLKTQRQGRKFSRPFTLYQHDASFYVAFTLVPKEKKVHRADERAQGGLRKVKPIVLKPGAPLPYIVGPRETARREPRQRILYSRYSGVFKGGMKTMNWGGLSGWKVNGGLPSLGKRRR